MEMDTDRYLFVHEQQAGMPAAAGESGVKWALCWFPSKAAASATAVASLVPGCAAPSYLALSFLPRSSAARPLFFFISSRLCFSQLNRSHSISFPPPPISFSKSHTTYGCALSL